MALFLRVEIRGMVPGRFSQLTKIVIYLSGDLCRVDAEIFGYTSCSVRTKATQLVFIKAKRLLKVVTCYKRQYLRLTEATLVQQGAKLTQCEGLRG